MAQAGNYRNVRFEPTWETDLKRLRNGQPPPAAVDEVISEVELVLARIAESYPAVGGTPFRVLNIPASRGLPPLNAWFRIESEKCVACYHLEEIPQAEEEDETVDEVDDS